MSSVRSAEPPAQSQESKGLTPIDICNWAVQETQSAVGVWLVAAPLDPKFLSTARTTVGAHGRKKPTTEQAKALFDEAAAGL